MPTRTRSATGAPGLTVTPETADQAPTTIDDATAAAASQEHTGTQVRIAGSGTQAANVTGLTDQTDLHPRSPQRCWRRPER